DIAVRTLADLVSRQLARKVLVENRPGAGGAIAAQAAAQARPDGHTLAQIPTGVFRNPHISKSGFNPPVDLTWVINIASYVFGVSVRTDSPWKTWREFAVYAKANPGKISFASPGIGSDLHVTMYLIAERDGIDWVQIPYKGTSEMLAAVRQGEVQAYAGTPPWEQIAAGYFRPLITWGERPTTKVPGVPTLRDIYGFVSNAPWGIAGPRALDPKVTALLHDAFRSAADEPKFVETLDRLGMERNYLSTADYTKYATKQFEVSRVIVEKLGLKP
ncbi:MAG: tripartite tricarboxylate transporter substrate binding protein, partial [Proteobacteria bacterium]|nr:tripartite tricarboxylate transporter substrate binding protein [Burkholderiales bacterium]